MLGLAKSIKEIQQIVNDEDKFIEFIKKKREHMADDSSDGVSPPQSA